ncbi:MAG: nitronate monooxygenase [Lachnospiraceae bacterium]|nr:nitronate monooxygenase [Lachnospiraceae bacterium]
MEKKALRIGDLVARIPVIQGGMGVGISLSELAGAVAAQGGIGTISAAQIGFRNPEFAKNPIETNLKVIKEEIEKAREIAKGGIIAINIMVATQFYDRYVKAAIDAGVDMIVSGAGLPMTLPKIAENAKTKLAPIVSSVKSADVICKYWLKKFSRLPDLVVIEGPKAGGHLGFSREQLDHIDEMDYDKEIVDIIAKVKEYAKIQEKEIPVVVAGGIYDREDMEHVMALGADGVQVATRFVTTYECDADEAYKKAYLDAKKEDIIIVQSPVGMPGRAILNPFMKKVKEGKIPHGRCYNCISTCKPLETPYCITEALSNAAEGNIDNGLLFCGANAYRSTKMEYVKDIMQEFSE